MAKRFYSSTGVIVGHLSCQFTVFQRFFNVTISCSVRAIDVVVLLFTLIYAQSGIISHLCFISSSTVYSEVQSPKSTFHDATKGLSSCSHFKTVVKDIDSNQNQ